MWQHITSPHNPRWKSALRLHDSRGRKQQGRILVCGVRETARASAAGLVFEEVFFCPDGLTGDELRVAEGLLKSLAGPMIMQLSHALFTKLAYGDRGGLVATASRPDSGLGRLERKLPRLIVVLDSVEKPGNIGALVRSADGAGSTAVVVADPLADLFHPNSIRASVATVFSVPVGQADASTVRQWLLDRGYRVLLADGSGSSCLFEADLTGPAAVVLGNEARGLGQSWRDFPGAGTIRIPMHGIADSLNVSVAGAVVMYESLRQRKDSLQKPRQIQG